MVVPRGERIQVFWEGEGLWFAGTVQGYVPTSDSYLVLYDDGDQHLENLDDPGLKWDLLAQQARAPPAPARATAQAAKLPDPPCPREPAAVSAWVAAAAMAEGLTLVHSSRSKTGFKHVSHHLAIDAHSKHYSKPFQLRVSVGGKLVHVGSFLTADEAALAYARRIGPHTSAMQARQMCPVTVEQALAAAQVEGLHLQRASNVAGYAHVQYQGDSSSTRPYRLQIRSGKCKVFTNHLTGTFGTAEEAALEVARYFARDPLQPAPTMQQSIEASSPSGSAAPGHWR